jgi:DNA-binding GntR family transcriptional regulator
MVIQILVAEVRMSSNVELRVKRVPAPIRSQVIDNLRQAILDRRLAPGEHLIERELVESMGVSRTSIREALRELAAEGLVTTIPNKGTVVASVSFEEAMQLYRVRATLEGLAGQLFVENASPAQHRALRKAYENVDVALRKGTSLMASKDRFYETLLEGSGNEALFAIAKQLHARVSELRALSLSVPGRDAESARELGQIVEAVEAGDVEAARNACAHHVEQAGRAAAVALAG